MMNRAVDVVSPELDAEMDYLGSVVLLDDPEKTEAIGLLDASDFGDSLTRVAFECVKALSEAGKPVDSVHLNEEMHARRGADGGTSARFIMDVIERVPTPCNVAYYAELVREHARKRLGLEAAQDVVRVLSHPGSNGKAVAVMQAAHDRVGQALAEMKAPPKAAPSTEWPEFPPVWRGSAAMWREWQQGTTEAPDCFQFAAWLTAYSVAIGKSAWTVSGQRLYPQFLCALVGPPGRSRKSTVIGRATALARELRPDLFVLNNWGSAEGALAAIAEHAAADPFVLLSQSELMCLFRKTLGTRDAAGGGASLVCDFYDKADGVIENAVRGGTVRVERLWLSLLGGITPENSGRLYSAQGIDCGLASRFVPFLGKPSQRIARPPMPAASGREAIARHMTKMASMAGVVKEFKLSPEAEQLHAEWYYGLPEEEDFSSRLCPHVLRLALVFAVDRDSPLIEAEDLLAAIEVGQYWGACAEAIYATWGAGKVERMRTRILELVERAGEVGATVRELQKRLGGGRLNVETFDRAWERLVRTRAVRVGSDGRRWVRG